MTVEAARGLVHTLKEEGVEWVSTFPTSVFNNAVGEEDEIENLMMRDERYAVAVADGFSRVSNGKRFGVCSVMGGLNAAGIQMAYGALAQAYEDGTPLLCLTEGVPLESRGKERFDITDAFKGVTKWIGYINRAERVPEFMRRAYTYLKTGRPGPILLQLARGVGEYDLEEFPYRKTAGWRSAGDPQDVKKAVKALIRAEKPLIWAGQGVFYADACKELLSFAEMVGAPVMTTLKGKSCFPEDHELSLGVRGKPVEHFLRYSDLIMTIGVGFNPSHFMHSIPAVGNKGVIQCTIDPMDINRNCWVDLAILGDVKLIFEQLIDEIGNHSRRGGDDHLLAEIEGVKKQKAEKYEPLMGSDETPINPYRVYGDMMKALDMDNSFVTHESGNTRDQLSTIYNAHTPHGFLGWGNVTTLGFGLGASIGAKLAYPNRQVICVTGDAGVGYQMGNWEALVRNNIGITLVHINNDGFGGYGAGFWGEGHTPYTSEVTCHHVQSSAEVAEGLGIDAERIEEPDEIIPSIQRCLVKNRSGAPALLEIICSQYPVYGQWVRG
ncbi:MAG: thiamine pyrophosphate-dependent enzyme [Candidatus Bathyarchaeia archaeon]